jgi:hypothetical protein
MAYNVKNSLKDENLKSKFSEEEKKKLETLIEEIIKWIDTH